MGCGCGAKTALAVKYVWQSKDGLQSKEFATKADAQYHRDQQGGGTVLTVAK